MFSYCLKCNAKVECLVKTKTETFNVKKEPITIRSRVCTCKKCGEELFNEELDAKNLELAYGEYRRKHNILSPAQIIALREKYGLSQRSLGALLGWGEITIHRYETGMLPDEAHNNLLSLLDNPFNMSEIYNKSKDALSIKAQEIVKKHIDSLIFKSWPDDFIINAMKSTQICDEYTGYTTFDYDKYTQQILFTLEETKGVYKTKLNKLLWYEDSYHFKKNQKSISGCIYSHYDYGPVPKNYEVILSDLEKRGLIGIEERTTGQFTGEFIIAKKKTDIRSLAKEEIEKIKFVIEKMGHLTASQLSARSHDEVGYKKTKPNQNISYKYAMQLSL